MTHKLLIEFDINFDSSLKGFLNPREVVRGEPVELKLSVVNLGTAPFPGGTVKNFRILYGPDRAAKHTLSTIDITCKEILSGHRVELSSEKILPLMDGLAWIWLSIEPKGDDKTVEYYQSPEDLPLGTGEWCNCFYVANREILLLSSQIRELAQKLKR